MRLPSELLATAIGAARLGLAILGTVLLITVGVLGFALLRERNQDPWACPADRLGVTIVDSAGTGGADTALDAVAERIPLVAQDAGLPEAILREAGSAFKLPTGRSATYRFVLDDGVVAEVSVGRLRDGTWSVVRIEQCFREP
jgi:hypothetical protein